MFERYGPNATGRDFAVGDIHGCFDALRDKLAAVGFDRSRDRLFSVGDLVDRGPQSSEALDWLAQPWFHAVRGNHEQMAIEWADGRLDAYNYEANGGGWNIANAPETRARFAAAFAALPIAMEIESPAGTVGIVHADCPVMQWSNLRGALEGEDGPAFEYTCLWSRTRIRSGLTQRVVGVRAVLVGHTPLKRMTRLGNVLYIDTGAVFGGALTVIDLARVEEYGT